MYKKIMVPLDGSELAECVLPQAQAIATGCGVSTVVLVRVVEPLILPIGEAQFVVKEEIWRETESELKAEAREYLDQLVGKLHFGASKLETQILFGPVSQSLADYAEKGEFDLIVISTHGRSGIGRWVWGSVADRLLRASCVPVLMVRAPGCVTGV